MRLFYKYIFNLPSNISDSQKNTYYISIFGVIIAILVHIIFLIIFYKYKIKPLYYFNYLSILCYSYLFMISRSKGMVIKCFVIASFEVLAHQTIAVYFLGWDYGFQYYIITVISYNLLGDFKKSYLPIFISILSFVLITWLYFQGQFLLQNQYVMDYTIKKYLYWFNLITTSILLAFFALIYKTSSIKNEKKLYVAATTDYLTNLLNRRKSMDIIDFEIIRSARSLKPFSIALCDIDDFKCINDKYGHDAGDIVLCSISKIIKKTLREQDHVGRWGGEEFIIILPETDLNTAKIAIEKVRKKISEHKVIIPKAEIQVTMTFGISSSSQENELDKLIKLADKSLYIGKHSTKNCIITSDKEDFNYSNSFLKLYKT